MISAIYEKNSHLSTKRKTENSKNTLELKAKIITAELILLHNKFAFVSINEASSIVHFVCQRNYAQVLISKIDMNNVNTRFDFTFQK